MCLCLWVWDGWIDTVLPAVSMFHRSIYPDYRLIVHVLVLMLGDRWWRGGGGVPWYTLLYPTESFPTYHATPERSFHPAVVAAAYQMRYTAPIDPGDVH